MVNFLNHLYELKLKLFYSCLSFCFTFISLYFFILKVIIILVRPFLKFVTVEQSDFIFTNLIEIFNIYIFLAFNIGIFITTPILLYFIFSFLKSGLFKHEKLLLFSFLKYFIFFNFFSLIFIYFIFLPPVLSFLLNLDIITNDKFFILKMDVKLYDYLILISNFYIFYSFIIFQIPLLFYIYIYTNKFRINFIYIKRKFLIFFCLIIGTLFSSPDFISLCLIFIPLLLSFEFIIFIFILKNFYQKFIL